MNGLTNKRQSRTCLLTIAVLAILVIGIWREFALLKREKRELEERVASLETLIDDLTSISLPIFFQKQTDTDFFLSPEERCISKRGSLYENILLELIEGPSPGVDLSPTLPKDTVLKGVELKGDIAYVNLGNLLGNLNVGSAGEAMVIFSIVNSMAQLPEIQKVQILIDGERIDTLAGHMTVYDPLEPDWTLVSW